MPYTIYVDGQEGTTGLKIFERLKDRQDITLLRIDPALRKDRDERARLINQAQVVFLCLPDDAAREAVSLCQNPDTIIIDASTAHRTLEDWAYGIPELSPQHRQAIAASKRVANPGCYATGFIMLAHPLVKAGIIAPNCPLTCHALSGYSGGGNKMIAQYEDPNRSPSLDAPRLYGLNFAHKHIPEMTLRAGLSRAPLFIPAVAPYYQGMTVSIPLPRTMMARNMPVGEIRALLKAHYEGQPFVRVMDENQGLEGGFLDPQTCNHTNRIDLHVFENQEQILMTACLDNLGKGASGAAVQSMNIVLGLDETLGLELL